MPRRSIRLLAVFAVLVGVLLIAFVVYIRSQPESPVETAPDEQKPFTVNPDEPYEVNYHAWVKPSGEGRGVIVKSRAPTTVRERGPDNEQGQAGDAKSVSFTLPPEALAKILAAVENRGVMKLQGSYKIRGLTDGPHVKFFIRQGDRVKRVDCSNYIPDEMKAFADDLNAVIAPHLAAPEKK